MGNEGMKPNIMNTHLGIFAINEPTTSVGTMYSNYPIRLHIYWN